MDEKLLIDKLAHLFANINRIFVSIYNLIR
jgi:hypothetical protein